MILLGNKEAYGSTTLQYVNFSTNLSQNLDLMGKSNGERKGGCTGIHDGGKKWEPAKRPNPRGIRREEGAAGLRRLQDLRRRRRYEWGAWG
jgi:hypothetical protein